METVGGEVAVTGELRWVGLGRRMSSGCAMGGGGGTDVAWRAAGDGVGGDVRDDGGVRNAEAPSRHAVDPVRGDGDRVGRVRGGAVDPVRAGEPDAVRGATVGPAVCGGTVDSVRTRGSWEDAETGPATRGCAGGGGCRAAASGVRLPTTEGWAAGGEATGGWAAGGWATGGRAAGGRAAGGRAAAGRAAGGRAAGGGAAGATVGVRGSTGGRTGFGAGWGSTEARAGRCSAPLDAARGATASRCSWGSTRARAGLGSSPSSGLGVNAGTGTSTGRSCVTEPVCRNPGTVGGPSSNSAGGLTAAASAGFRSTSTGFPASPTSSPSRSGSAGRARRGRGADSATSPTGAFASIAADRSSWTARTGSAARTEVTCASGCSTGSLSAVEDGPLERRGVYLTTASASSGSSSSALRGRVTGTVSQAAARTSQGSNAFVPDGTRSAPAKWFRKSILWRIVEVLAPNTVLERTPPCRPYTAPATTE